MLLASDEITAIDYDEDLSVVVVRTSRETDYEAKLQKKFKHPAVRKAQFTVILWRSLNP